MAKQQILIVEDERDIVKVVEFNLKEAGFEPVVAYDAEQARSLIRQRVPDLVLLDLMLPELSGVEVTRIVRSESDVPIVMLTAKGAEIDKVVGLELGADDYVTKPYSARELIARIRATSSRRLNGFVM